MAFRVLFDACVLIPMPHADIILRLADRNLFQPLWSAQILEEVERNLITQLSVSPEGARRRVSSMRKHFPGAAVEGHEHLVNAMTNDAKDRHVLAAAVRANAGLLVTDNVKDFPPATLKPYDIKAVSTDEFLLDLLDLDAPSVVGAMREACQALRNPSITWDDYLERATYGLPEFVNAVRAHLGADA